MLKGHCCCCAIRYEVLASAERETACHCTICRRSSGAPFVAWFAVLAATFRIVAGQPASFRSTAQCMRTFCGACGTPLTFQSAHSVDKIDVTTCSLEDPEQVPPRSHTFVRSQLSWVKLADGLPIHAAAAPRDR